MKRSRVSPEEWKLVSEKIKYRFSQIPRSEIESLEGHLDQLPEKIVEFYGYDKRQAIEECEEFINPLNPLVELGEERAS